MKQFVRRQWFIIALSVLFIGLNAWAICSWYTYQLNPDGMSYITIASKYAHGDIKHAINGYWGPLISWMIAPAFWVHANPIVWAKLILLAAGTCILVIAYWVLRYRYKVSRVLLYGTCLFLVAPLSEWVTYDVITPDLILAVWIVLFGLGLSEFLREPSRRLGIQLGILGALMYLTKGFGLYLFLGTVGICALWQWRYEDREGYKVTVRRYLPILITLAILVLPFIAVFSLKYQKLTINNAGTFDWNVYGIHGQSVQPIDSYGPLAPPNSTALSAWEDPSRLSSLSPNWFPLSSKHALKYFVMEMLWPNFNAIFSIMQGYGAYIEFAFALLIIGCLQRTRRREFIVFTLIVGLMVVGYSIIFIDARYLWGGVIFAILAATLLLSQFEQKKMLSTLQLGVAGVIIAGVSLMNVTQAIVGSRDTGQSTHDIAMAIKQVVPQGSRVVADDFPMSFPVCYFLSLHCYNVLDPPATNSDPYYQLLKSDGITYYLDLHQSVDPARDVFVQEHGFEVYDQTIDGTEVSVYKFV